MLIINNIDNRYKKLIIKVFIKKISLKDIKSIYLLIFF